MLSRKKEILLAAFMVVVFNFYLAAQMQDIFVINYSDTNAVKAKFGVLLFPDDTLLHGKYYTYFKSGRKAVEGVYEKGLRVGVFYQYYDSTGSPIEAIAHYNQAGKLDGDYIVFYPNGDTLQYTLYRNDIMLLSKSFYQGNILRNVSRFKNGKLHGEVLEYYPTGILKSKIYYEEGKQHGKAYLYYPSGALKAEEDYVNSFQDGWIRTYFDTNGTTKGAPAIEMQVKRGVRDGIFKRYDPQGHLLEEGFFRQNLPHGEYKEYYPSGQIRRKIVYDLGTRIGQALHYHENGQVAKVIDYKDREIQQSIVEFDTSGNKLREYQLYKHKPHGKWIEYYPGGAIKEKRQYKDGLLDGWVKTYDEQGHLQKEEPYKAGRMEGEAIYYYPNGKVHKKVTYKYGRKHGTYVEYTAESTEKQRGQFANDLPHGEWIITSENGKKRVLYQHGVIMKEEPLQP